MCGRDEAPGHAREASNELGPILAAMDLTASLCCGKSSGDRLLKVNHAGEHGAVHIYAGQILTARWTAASMLPALREFEAHEEQHRGIFWAELLRLEALTCTRCES